MKWKTYQSNILPLLQNYRNDILPDDMNDEDFIDYLKNFPVDEQIHKIIIDLIYEKPVKEDLDNLLKKGIKHEYDQLIEVISTSKSFEEANVLAQNVWDL